MINRFRMEWQILEWGNPFHHEITILDYNEVAQIRMRWLRSG